MPVQREHLGVRDPTGALIVLEVHQACLSHDGELQSDDDLELETDSDMWAAPLPAEEDDDEAGRREEPEPEGVLREEPEPDDDDDDDYDDDGRQEDHGVAGGDVDSQSDSALIVYDSHSSDPEWQVRRRRGGRGVGRGRGSRGPGSRGGKRPRISGRPVGRPLKNAGRNDNRGAAKARRKQAMCMVPGLFATTAEQVCMHLCAVWRVTLTCTAGVDAAREQGPR